MAALEDSVVVVSADAAQVRVGVGLVARAQLRVLVDRVVPVQQPVLAGRVVQAADSVEAGSVEVELRLSRQSFSAAMAKSTPKPRTTYEPVPRSS